MSLDKYKTVNDFGQAEIIEKKSRFIANVAPVKTEEEAQAFVEKIKKEHYNARHNCYAYIVGENSEYQKFSDDGEPGGTAGRPIFDVLKGEELTNTVVVVTRYFGGILLGTGGLVRAYSKSAKEGVLAAEIAEMLLLREVRVECDYSLLGKVQYEIAQEGHILKDTLYTDKVELIVMCLEEKAQAFADRIENVTNTLAKCTLKDQFFAKVVDGKIIE